MPKASGIIGELSRRRVFRTAAVYGIVAFIVAQVADLVLPGLLLPDWTFRLIVLLLLLGFPIALVLAWSFDVTPEGVRRAEPVRAPSGADEEKSDGAGPAVLGSPRAAGLVGVGVLVALIGFGGYHFIGQPVNHESGQPGSADDGRHTIAVLPFTNMAGGDENEYFADGITEDILTNLGMVPRFTVISRTSVMRYKGTNKSIPEIAAELGVRYVLEGSLRRSGDRVRVVTQLVEPGTDTQIWAQTLDRRIEDIFAVQSEIAQAVVEALRVELAGGVGERIGRAPTDNLEAYELFLHGRDFYYQYSHPAMRRAIDLFRRAIELDPAFALAHAWLGSAYAVSVFNYGDDPALFDLAVESAERAVDLQPDLADAYRALGTALGVSGRLAPAIPALERAIELNPNDFAAIGNLGLLYAFTGAWDRAIELTHRSIRFDPVRSYIAYGNLGSYYRIVSLLDRAVESSNHALALRFDDIISLNNLAWISLIQGRPAETAARAEQILGGQPDARALADAGHLFLLVGDEARARTLLEESHSLAPDALPLQGYAPSVMLAYILQGAGENGRALRLLRDAERVTLEAVHRGSANPAMEIALAGIALLTGRRSEAVDHFERAVELGWNDPMFVEHDPILAPLQGEPRFEAAMARMRERNEAMRRRIERGS